MVGNWQIHVAFEVWGVFFCLMAAVIAWIASEKKQHRRMWLPGLFLTQALALIFDSLAWIFHGNESSLGSFMIRISAAGVFVLNYLLITVLIGCLCASVKKEGEPWVELWIGGVISAAGIALVVFTQFTPILYRFDATNHYLRANWYPLAYLVGFIGIALELVLLTKYRRCFATVKQIALYIYLLTPFIVMVLQQLFTGTLSVQILSTISLMCLFTTDMYLQTKQLVKQERELSDMKIQVVLAQMKPHFMYNVLNTISYLCDKDAQAAKKALHDFSKYLRGNLNSLTSRTPVTLDQELKLIDQYLSLEKLRMGDELNIIYDINDNGYMLPMMTLEPFVENAVAHGLEKAEAGGTLSIRTRAGERAHEIIIEDDGVGFNPDENMTNKTVEHKSIGIEIARKRLWSTCKGTVTIHSQKGTGTSVLIQIPYDQSDE